MRLSRANMSLLLVLFGASFVIAISASAGENEVAQNRGVRKGQSRNHGMENDEWTRREWISAEKLHHRSFDDDSVSTNLASESTKSSIEALSASGIDIKAMTPSSVHRDLQGKGCPPIEDPQRPFLCSSDSYAMYHDFLLVCITTCVDSSVQQLKHLAFWTCGECPSGRLSLHFGGQQPTTPTTPTPEPSPQPITPPTGAPSSAPSNSEQPSSLDSFMPSSPPSDVQTNMPSSPPSEQPSSEPIGGSLEPSFSLIPSFQPSGVPESSEEPSIAPSKSSQPSLIPSAAPSSQPVMMDSPEPSLEPSSGPSPMPAAEPEFVTEVDLTKVDAKFQPAFTAASERWSEVIVADLTPQTVVADDISQCPTLSVSEIDDVYVCAYSIPGSGPGNILGTARPLEVRGNLLPYLGEMMFYEAALQDSLDDGKLEGLILHEMAHVYGVGILWEALELVNQFTTPCSYAMDSKASAAYQTLSGCTGAIPLDEVNGVGSECRHWDPCLKDELMTSFVTGTTPLSTLTIGALEDLGYTVDYGAADTFTDADIEASCSCIPRGAGEEMSPFNSTRRMMQEKQRKRRRLSPEGRRKATDHGKRILASNREKRPKRDAETDRLYVGDLGISVLYIEEGEVYSVLVTGDSV